MMEAVKRGGDRQKLHEIIRRCSMAATERMKQGENCDLLERLAEEKEFGMTAEEMARVLEPSGYIGRCAEQVTVLIEQIRPLFTEEYGEAEPIEL